MKRIRNAALLAAALAVSSFSHAQEPHSARQRSLAEEALAPRAPQMHRHADRAEQAVQHLDHLQEARLNDRSRADLRRKGREDKLRLRTND